LDVDFDVAQYMPRIKAIGRKYVFWENDFIDFSDTIKLSDEALAERPPLNGDAPKIQPVDMVFIGSETGHIELRYQSLLSSRPDNIVSLEHSLSQQ
jgi:hypothetical protein